MIGPETYLRFWSRALTRLASRDHTACTQRRDWTPGATRDLPDDSDPCHILKGNQNGISGEPRKIRSTPNEPQTHLVSATLSTILAEDSGVSVHGQSRLLPAIAIAIAAICDSLAERAQRVAPLHPVTTFASIVCEQKVHAAVCVVTSCFNWRQFMKPPAVSCSGTQLCAWRTDRGKSRKFLCCSQLRYAFPGSNLPTGCSQ